MTATTTPTTTTQTTTTPTTTATPLPAECRSAINLTEYWRKDHSDSGIRPVDGNYNCDTRDMIAAGRPWFRFAGPAGNRLLDHCIPSYWSNNRGSCGTGAALWSNDQMPKSIGSVTTINVYGSYNSNCKWYSGAQCEVMRCSNEAHDYIYRILSATSTCNYGFCGMN